MRKMKPVEAFAIITNGGKLASPFYVGLEIYRTEVLAKSRADDLNLIAHLKGRPFRVGAITLQETTR